MAWIRFSTVKRATQIKRLLQSFGLRSQTQSYAFSSIGTDSQIISNGTNVHAILHAPRTDGSEALVLMASWQTRKPGSDIRGANINVRGVASVLALAEYLITFNLWSKDIIFLIADGYLDGTHAWLKAYHGLSQSNLKMEALELKTGSIWAALNIDFPFHSFSHIGIDYEGINGQLPNLDLINTVAHIVRWTGSCPVTMHSEPLEPSYPSYLPDHPEVQRYFQAGRTIIKQMSYGLTGSPSGPEGLFSTYRIDAISLFAYPADGPHGFHTIGTIIESSLRSLNNLLERLHQSFFLYLLQSESKFLSVAMYLIVPLLIGIGLTIKGLAKWGIANQEWEKLSSLQINQKSLLSPEKFGLGTPNIQFENQKGDEIIWSLSVIGFTHLVGALVYTSLIRYIDPNQARNSVQIYLSLLILTSLPLLILKFNPPRKMKTVMIFEPIQLMLSGCFISVISVLNFPLGVGIGFVLSIHPFAVIASAPLAFFFFFFDGRDLSGVLYNHIVHEAWFLPVFVTLIAPLLVHSVIVRLLKTFY
ncbi:hypothetical protein Pst134EA_031767 [Puccinia striiformis f. sp. tritici]|uniref:Uncharacterized protein n=1 Tax=Puccinia striiformis f. sp. tritici PST-78 TaxID=1165861 RepID=A0A0L0VX69_9BASI|nr:uncharacterized protein Pst134EA_031767 [Puccinia striiformis f. sp. tritici]KAH9442610.1 hypothetical protein Pst134EA_031767 [Puccinia striiformis f. sp. tritici]KNF03904.1 hypothetical protein, variant [Puccinia striiformis f. sp. tritici PST-78]